ncbi:MAG: FHA domain-containing protein [Pyrinomonadaceae bacterium]
MRIVLAIERDTDRKPNEETFSLPRIRIGRDAVNSEISFDNSAFRMVSRHHAEIRLVNGQWMVGDMGSSFGTFLDGEQISKPAPLRAGSAIQFGKGGPRAFVIYLDQQDSPGIPVDTPVPNQPVAPPAIPEAPNPSAPHVSTGSSGVLSAPSIPTPSAPLRFEQPQTPKGTAKLILETKGGPRVFEVGESGLKLGREPSCDVVIEASAVMVSRHHADVRLDNGSCIVQDNQSFNGTIVNEHRITGPTPLSNGDVIKLGLGGPTLRFSGSGFAAPASVSVESKKSQTAMAGTMIFNIPSVIPGREGREVHRKLIGRATFDGRPEITIGRSNDNDLTLDGLQISNRHAKLRETPSAVIIEDLNSTNGVYVNGNRVAKHVFASGDSVRIGAFIIEIDEYGAVCVYDTRAKTRIDAIGISKEVKDRNGRGKIKLLDNISISIPANEFVGLLGPSGAGKSTFMDALNGMRPPDQGNVQINGQDLYLSLDSLKQQIGYVPQDEILHRELSVEKTLYYVAKLRLSRDVSKAETAQIINEVLDVTGLVERRHVPIGQLSGGQRKRVSIAVELITKPSVIFLDEPTSGLDPSTEEKIMHLFRQIAESGRTVILTTHAMENVKLFDKIVVLMRGKLVFYGRPSEALTYFGVESFKDLYDRLQENAGSSSDLERTSSNTGALDAAASEWQGKFASSRYFEQYVGEPLKESKTDESGQSRRSKRLGIFGALRQWLILSGRYSRVLLKDRFNLFVLLAQAPVIALMIYFVMGSNQPRDFAYFALSLCAIWFGTSVAAREVVRERRMYDRERMVNLGIIPYLSSKFTVLAFIVLVQSLLLFIPLKLLHLSGLMPLPGILGGMPQFVVMLLTAGVGVAVGLFVSVVVRTSETATSLIPLILIPQIVFSGLTGVPTGINKVVGMTMPATWAFDSMKRFSSLDTLEPDGAFKNGETEGKGLYKSIEEKNDRVIADARKNIKDYESDLEQRLKDAERRADNGETVKFSGLPDRPEVGEAVKIPDDLSNYISFLHPWMNDFLNPFVLIFMMLWMFGLAIIALKLQDIL